MIRVYFSDQSVGEYSSEKDAEHEILEAHAEGVSIDYICDANDDTRYYSLIWNVKLQKEFTINPKKDIVTVEEETHTKTNIKS